MDGMEFVSQSEKREPPANSEAEQGLLGAILVSNAAYHRVSEFLQPEHFALGVHGRIYAAIGTLIDRGENANPIALKNLFENDDALKEVGGAGYLIKLAANVVSILNAPGYGKTIKDLYLRRELMRISEELAESANFVDLDHPATDLIVETEEALYNLAVNGSSNDGGLRLVGEAARVALQRAENAVKKKGAVRGIPTGLQDLDQMLGGIMPDDFIVLAGRPSMGKTVLVQVICKKAARYFKEQHDFGDAPPRAVAFFSLEMSSEKIAARELAESGVSTDRQRKGDLTGHDFEKMVAAAVQLADLPYFIDDTPALNVARIRHRARRLARKHGLGMIVIDHLQKMRMGSKIENRRLEIGEFTSGLAALGRELGVPVILLSQLSRAVESRDDKRPTLQDLRESGDIEQDADIVIFLYRHEYYLSRTEPQREPKDSDQGFNDRYEEWKNALEASRGITQLLVAKNRDGGIGKVEVLFDAERSTFVNLAREPV